MVAMIRYADLQPPAVAGAVARALPAGARTTAPVMEPFPSASRFAAVRTVRPASPYAASSAAFASASAALDGAER